MIHINIPPLNHHPINDPLNISIHRETHINADLNINIPPHHPINADLNIPIPHTREQRAVHKAHLVALSCKTDEHRKVLDNMMDNIYDVHGYDTWHDAKCLITRE